MNRFKTGDTVIVASGKDRGRSGRVIKVLPRTDRVIVEGLNLQSRRVKARRSGSKGQVVQTALPIDQSRVLPWCAVCKKGVRVRFNILADQKVRICAKCNSKL